MKRINVIFSISVVILFTLLSSAMAEDLPSSWDWRDYGGVTSVKNQGQCGSCWAFATVATVESAILIHGSSNDLSEQHLVSCNTEGWDCTAGGWTAFRYYRDRNDSCGLIGTVQEPCFPYQAQDVPCSCCGCNRVHEIADWGYIPSIGGAIPDNQTMKEYIYHYGPIWAACDCTNWTLRLYQSGTVTEHEGSNSLGDINHAIVIVGWDDDYYGAGVWIIKNSWGTLWQDGGYGYVHYDTGQIGYGACWVDYSGSAGLKNCDNAIALTPGVPYDGTTVGSTSFVDFYSCIWWEESGPEVVHSITTTTSGQDITATLSNLSVDLDVFILDACNPDSCVAYGNTTATYSNAPAGTYFIVVDGCLGVSGSYTLKVFDPDDTDLDGLPDSWETFYFGNLDQEATEDYDTDGLNNLEEYQYETDPTNWDTDDDGYSDGDEVNIYETDPNDTDDYPQSPDKPTVITPSNGSTAVSTNPAVTSSSFSDLNQGGAEGLAAQWQFEGNALDETDNGNDGTVHGAVYTSGRVEQALNFDGVNDYVNCGDPVGNNEDVTFEAWAYPEGGYYILSSGGQTGSVGYAIIWKNGQFVFMRKTETKSASSGYFGSYGANQWYHLAGVYDDSEGTLKVYIDGTLYNTYPATSGSYSNSWPELHIGKPNNINAYYFKGTIDEVAIYNRALSESEIQEHYQRGLNGEHNPVAGGDIHASSGWEVYEDTELTQIVWSSYDDTAHLTSTTVDSTNGTFAGSLSGSTRLTMGNDYWVRVRHTDDRGGDSPWSETNRFTTEE